MSLLGLLMGSMIAYLDLKGKEILMEGDIYVVPASGGDSKQSPTLLERKSTSLGHPMESS